MKIMSKESLISDNRCTARQYSGSSKVDEGKRAHEASHGRFRGSN